MQITTVTTKGQVTIPKEIRDKLGIKPGDKVISEKVGDEIRVRPVPDFFSLRGSVKTKKKYDKKAIEKAVGERLAKRYLKTIGKD